MSDPTLKVECAHHGDSIATFTCRHIRDGIACGYFCADVDDAAASDPYPDAWCAACEEVANREGGWNDRSEAFAGISVSCTHCYERSRTRNELLPEGISRDDVRLDFARSTQFLAAAMASIQAKQDAAERRTSFSRYARWRFDPDAAEIVFEDPERTLLRSRVTLVGSYSRQTSSWMWSWDNPQLDRKLVRDTNAVRVFGEVRGLERLAKGYLRAEENEAWEMTSIAAHLLGGEAIYRAPMDQLSWFMLLHALVPDAASRR